MSKILNTMRPLHSILLLISILVFNDSPAFGQKTDTYDDLVKTFHHPTQSAKPKVYWWILSVILDTIRAKQEMCASKEPGIGL